MKNKIVYGVIGLFLVLSATFLFLAHQTNSKNYELQQNINKTKVEKKVVYEPKLSQAELETKKKALEQQFDLFLKDNQDKSYKGYNGAKKIFQATFFASSGNYSADANNHDANVAFYKDFSYEINDISGTYNGKNKVVLFVNITVKLKGNVVVDHRYYSYVLDQQDRLIGGSIYGK